MKKRSLFLLWTFMSSALLLSAGPVASGDRITVTDMGGRRIEVPRDPARIVCAGPGSLRQICYLGAQDRVVGVERMEKVWNEGRPYWLANPELAKLPSIGPGGPAGINAEPDLESVLKVDPEVIFISYMEPVRADAMERKIGIPVVLLSSGRFATFDEVVYASLRLAAGILGKESRAEQVVAFIQGAKKDLRHRTASIEQDGERLVYIGGIGYKGTQGIESTDPDYIPFQWIDAKNPVRGIQEEGHLFLEREKLLAINPEVIFLDGGGLARVAADYDRKHDFYQSLKAFRGNRVYALFPYNWYVTNIGTAIADAYAVGKILHPKRFSDVNPDATAEQIYTFLVGKPVLSRMEKTYGKLGRVVGFLHDD